MITVFVLFTTIVLFLEYKNLHKKLNNWYKVVNFTYKKIDLTFLWWAFRLRLKDP